MQAITVDNVSYRYLIDDAELTAVDRVSLSIEEREFVVLLGANGTGKSTLAKMLNGLLVPQEGTVTVYGDSTADETDEVIFRIRSTVGMVFQNPDNQMVASIIEDDVAFGPENLGVPHDEIVERVEWALNAVGMLDYRRHTPLKLSGGQKQRVAIASVLAMKPKVLVLDESTAMLDPMGRAEVLSVLHDLNRRENMTVVLITHHMDECVGADRAVVLEDGHVAFSGKPHDLFADEALVTRCGLELPPVAKIASLLHDKGYAVDAGECDLNDLAEQICRLK
ncbi:MAG: energy-coupling factor transporter ATPase [Clostridia bacterium]|nr:energy-coupling factor transporter ATPase [Clostridia bacterium]